MTGTTAINYMMTPTTEQLLSLVTHPLLPLDDARRLVDKVSLRLYERTPSVAGMINALEFIAILAQARLDLWSDGGRWVVTLKHLCLLLIEPLSKDVYHEALKYIG